MNVTVLYQNNQPELINMLTTYHPDNFVQTKLYYENNYPFLNNMTDRFIYYMLYLATYRMLESSFISGRDQYADPNKLKELMCINPELLKFDLSLFEQEINMYILPYPNKVKFLTGLCVIATNEMIILQNNIDNMDIYKMVFTLFNNKCMQSGVA